MPMLLQRLTAVFPLRRGTECRPEYAQGRRAANQGSTPGHDAGSDSTAAERTNPSAGRKLRAASRCSLCLLIALSFCCGTALADSAAQQGVELQQIKGELYRFSRKGSGQQDSGVMLLGSTGAVVGDPLDAATASSLDTLIREKFNTSVIYVFYTRASPQRAAGAAHFVAGGATLIAHENAVHAEAVSTGLVTAPTLVFNDSLSLNLGESWSAQDESVVLRHLGRSASDDMIIAHFPSHDAVFASDFVAVESLPLLALEQGFFPDWFAAIDKLAQIDFSYLLPGQGEIGIRSDAIAHGHYLRELNNRVRRRVQQGEDSETIASEINLRRFQRWRNYDTALADNVRAMIQVVNEQADDNRLQQGRGNN